MGYACAGSLVKARPPAGVACPHGGGVGAEEPKFYSAVATL